MKTDPDKVWRQKIIKEGENSAPDKKFVGMNI